MDQDYSAGRHRLPGYYNGPGAGRGLCAEIAPELVTLDDWGFPMIPDSQYRLAG